MKNNENLPDNYAEWILDIKQRIAGVRQKIVLSANSEQIKLYHSIGLDILSKQQDQGWGAKVIDRISRDLNTAFPEMKGFSASNLKYMRSFASECPDILIGQKSADQLACKIKNRLVAEYALSGIEKPMGVAEYQLVRALPDPLDTCLPTIEEIEAEFSGGNDE